MLFLRIELYLSLMRNQKKIDDKGVIHKGLAQRSFKRSFNLADDIEVQKAQLKNGLLSIRMERIVPDEKKPQKIKLSK